MITRLSLCSALLATAACSTSLITQKDGRVLEGKIVTSSAESIVLAVGDREVAVARADVSRIDYPGQGAIIAGAVMTGVGGAGMIVSGTFAGTAADSGSGLAVFAILLVGFTPSAVIHFAGVGTLWAGLAGRGSAKGRASKGSDVSLSPLILPDSEGRLHAGAAVTLSW